MFKRFIIFLFWTVSCHEMYSQNDSILFKRFYHSNGAVSSEGFIKNDLPVGVWKNYYENTMLKSLGKRLNNKPDSIWMFYNEFGVLLNEVFFKNGIKNGLDIKYSSDGFILSKEFFVDGKKEGFSYYYQNQLITRKVFYQNDVISGYAYEYSKKGEINAVLSYTNGFIKIRDQINRLNSEGKKEGKWIDFYECLEPCSTFFKVHKEGRYLEGLKNGYFKEFDRKGELISTLLYRNDSLVKDVDLEQIDVRVEYYSNALVKSRKGYKRDVLEGNSMEFNQDGTMSKGEVYKNGVLVAQGGIFDSLGLRHGPWKLFYSNGTIQAEGTYKNGLKYGDWSYYHSNNQLSQKGSYGEKELPKGTWIWYYENGSIIRKERFKNGLEEGELLEYNDTNLLVTQGTFMEGQKDGDWMHISGDYKMTGSFISDEMDGEWIHTYLSNNNLAFKGRFSDGIPVDKHTWYHPNGKRMLEGVYEAGERMGDWRRFDENGIETLIITYDAGNEVKINGVKVKPQSTEDFSIDDYKIMDSIK
jgi:antitoxin component YwqK of YwqJK toxin-antitoxin module